MFPDERRDAGTYLLEQRFRYEYSSPAHRLRHRLLVVPRGVHGGQHRFDYGLKVAGSPVRVSETSDRFGNHVVQLYASDVAEWIEFTAWARVGISPRGHGVVTALPAAIADDRGLLAPTRLTRAEGVLAAAARELSVRGGDGLDLAERACAWANDALTYTPGVTNVQTSAADAVDARGGVCQDYAHIMLALCRAAGLPARYVSGHLVGEGGSHAWVEVVVRDPDDANARAIAVAFDPTHNRRATYGYITVAVGYDYTDVAPTSGSFVGECPGVLSASKRLSLAGSTSA